MLGFLYYRQRQMRRAFLYLKEAFLEDPDDHALYSTILKIAEEIQNLDEMEGLIKEALVKHPESGRLHGMLKRLKRMQG
jgi:tetratricopeptide (TPR) repeat protein